MIVISNMHWTHKPFSQYPTLERIIKERIQALNINIKLSFNEDKFTFYDVKPNMTFVSSVDNMITMRPGDIRIKKNNRNYLLSKRPTEKQYVGFFETLHKIFDELNLNADILLTNEKKNLSLVLRKDKVNYYEYPKVTSFPIAKGETDASKKV